MSGRPRRVKIVAVLGPATDRNNSLEEVTVAGVNVVRMNFSHGSSEDHKMRVDKVREIVTKLGRHVVILGDLQGPKIRASTFKEGEVPPNIEDKFLLDANLSKGESDEGEVGTDYKDLPADIVPGDILLLDDGRVQPRVLEVQGMKMLTKVVVGDPLPNNKGINKLDGDLSTEVLTEKDRVDIRAAALAGVGHLAVSFLRCGEDLNYARCLAYNAGCDTKIVAKVERAEAVCSQEAMDDIIFASDVVVVAHGDFGVEIGDPGLAGIQKVLIHRARQLNRAVITVTQMMEPVIANPVPTRAGVMGVTNAVLDGTNAVILSAETAVGQHPSETIATMARVRPGAEKIPSINASKHHLGVQFDNMGEAIAMSTAHVANHLKDVVAITTMTESGHTALITSHISSGLPIFAMSRHERMLNLTALYRSVTPVHFDSADDDVTATSKAVNLLRDKGYLVSGNLVIVTQGNVMSTVGSTNTARTLAVE